MAGRPVAPGSGGAKGKSVHVRLTDDLYGVLNRRAETERRSVSWIICDILDGVLRLDASREAGDDRASPRVA